MRPMTSALVVAALALLAPAAAASAAPFDLVLATTEAWEKPQSVVVFPAQVTNKADTPIRLDFEVASKTDGLQAPQPNPVTLQGAKGAIRALSIPFTVHTPFHNGYVDEDGTVTYRVRASHPESHAPLGDPQEFTLTVHTKGFYAPGPQLFGAMLALAVAALVLRRKR